MPLTKKIKNKKQSREKVRKEEMRERKGMNGYRRRQKAKMKKLQIEDPFIHTPIIPSAERIQRQSTCLPAIRPHRCPS